MVERGGGVRDGSPIDVAFRVTGVEPEAVGEAVRRVLEHPGWLTSRARSVLRLAGLSRLAAAPGLRRVVDVGLRVLRCRTGRLG